MDCDPHDNEQYSKDKVAHTNSVSDYPQCEQPYTDDPQEAGDAGTTDDERLSLLPFRS